MKLLRVISSINPRIGGPAAGLRALTPVLADLGHETTCVCLDAPGTLPRDVMPAATVHTLGPAHGSYCYQPRLRHWLREHRHEFDAVFVHGLWQYHGVAVESALRGSSVPYFVFPHGMLDPWFNRAYPLKHAKKRVYWSLFGARLLRNAAAVLFTCEEERRLARQSFPGYTCTERVVAYGTALPSADLVRQRLAFSAKLPDLADRPFLLFLGRIHEKKGVDLLLKAYGELAQWRAREAPSATFPALVVAGPCADAAYLAKLQQLAAGLPKSCTVHWPGMLEGEAKWGALRAADAFILPSHQENFGIAVVEALAVGTPVLISNQVNIWHEIEQDGAGFVAADSVPGTLDLMQRWMRLAPGAKATMRRAASESFLERYEISRVADSLISTVEPFVQPDPFISGNR